MMSHLLRAAGSPSHFGHWLGGLRATDQCHQHSPQSLSPLPSPSVDYKCKCSPPLLSLLWIQMHISVITTCASWEICMATLSSSLSLTIELYGIFCWFLALKTSQPEPFWRSLSLLQQQLPKHLGVPAIWPGNILHSLRLYFPGITMPINFHFKLSMPYCTLLKH